MHKPASRAELGIRAVLADSVKAAKPVKLGEEWLENPNSLFLQEIFWMPPVLNSLSTGLSFVDNFWPGIELLPIVPIRERS